MKDSRGHMALAVCKGCGIGDCIRIDSLIQAAKEAAEGIHCMEHAALCSESGLEQLHTMCRESRIDRLAIAACSPRIKSEQFRMDGLYVDRINLREQVAWVMEPENEDTQMLAEDQTRMVLAKLASISEVVPYVPDQVFPDVLVVGGGIAGLTAALKGAEAGYPMHLVERSNALGGYAGRVYKMVPSLGDQVPLQEPDVALLAERVQSHKNIKVYLGASIDTIAGEPGRFAVTLQNKKRATLSVGSVVVATGWRPYDTGKLEYLGYGSSRVVTLEEFEEKVRGGVAEKKPEKVYEKVPDRVLFVMCAGSRDENHLSYCSSYCCSAALKQALYVREKNPDSQVYIIYKDIRTAGFQEEFYKTVQADEAIFMTKGSIDTVADQGNAVQVEIKDSLLGDKIRLETDLVVLATGMVPNSTEDLRLQYRLGMGLPEIEYEFSDSHFICFPYETRRTGIYAAGTVRAPMDMESSQEDGAGAMMKAIQSIECVKRGEAVHPRSGDLTYPELYMDRCTDCKRCTEECPFGSYDENEKGTPLPNPARCRRCGICLGSCPERVIGFADFSINSVSAMIKSVHVPDEFEEKPRVLVFVCENDAYPALDAAGVHHLGYSPFVRIIPVRCLGSINKVWISDALSHGYDGILQIGCKPGDNYQCHFIHGSELTEQRAENLQETLETMMLEPERIRTRFVEITDHHAIQEIINEYMEELELIGPNPFKSM